MPWADRLNSGLAIGYLSLCLVSACSVCGRGKGRRIWKLGPWLSAGVGSRVGCPLSVGFRSGEERGDMTCRPVAQQVDSSISVVTETSKPQTRERIRPAQSQMFLRVNRRGSFQRRDLQAALCAPAPFGSGTGQTKVERVKGDRHNRALRCWVAGGGTDFSSLPPCDSVFRTRYADAEALELW